MNIDEELLEKMNEQVPYLCDICLLHIDETEYLANGGICDDCKWEQQYLKGEEEYELPENV